MAINVGSCVAYLTLDRSNFRNSLHSAGADLRSFATSTDGIGSRINHLGSAMGGIGAGLTKAVTLPLVGVGALCVKFASDFETSMAKVSTVAGASKQELAGMKSDILKASADMGMSAKDFGNATYEALSSGIGKADAVKFTKDAAVLAKGGFTDVTTATDILTSTMNAYGKSAKDATEISNQLIITQNLGKTEVGQMGQSLGNVIPIAAALGVKTNELFSSIAATTSQGIKTGESITGIKAAMSNIVKASGPAKKAAESLGLQFDANAVKTKGWMGFLQDVKSKLETSAPVYAKTLAEVNRLKAAVDGNTGASSKYAAVIDQEKAKVAKLREEKKALTSKDKDRKGAIDAEIKSTQAHIKVMRDEEKQNKKGAGSVAALKKELKGKEKTLKVLERTSKGTLTAFSTMFGSVEGLNAVMSMTSSGGAKVYNDSMKQMKENTNAAKDAADKMDDTPEEKFKKAKAGLQVLAIQIGGMLLPQIVKLMEGFSKLLEKINNLPGPVKHGIVALAGIAAAVGPTLLILSKLITSVRTVMSVFKGLSTAANVFKLLPALCSPVGIAVAIVAVAAYAIIKNWDKVGPFFKRTLGGIGKFFKKCGSDALIGCIPVVGIPLLIMKHWKKLGPFFAKVGAKAKKFGEKVKKFGGYVIDGLIYGIKNGVPNLFKLIKWVGNKIADTFKKVLGIHSPSTVFAGFGGFIIDGLFGGLVKGFKKVIGFVSKMGNGIKNTFKKVLGINSPSVPFDSYGGFIGEGLIGGLDKQDGAITAKFKGLGNKIKGLGNVKPDFSGLNSTALHGPAGSGGRNGIGNLGNVSNSSNKKMGITQNVKMYVTIADTGAKGTEQLTNEFKNMSEIALKNSMVNMFMQDATRN